jgi:hypothetical protein
MVLMAAVLDHLFICTSVGAPAAEQLCRLGLTEGSPNRHPGQGTANRRFFFQNAMLELLWVENAAEAQRAEAGALRLWERWSAAGRAASPFGIIVRPQPESEKACPFDAWDYRPPTMPDLQLRIAAATGIEEPMWCYIETGRKPIEAPPERRQPLEHPAGLREVTRVHLVCPPLPEASVTAAMARAGVIGLESGAGHLVELHFDGALQGKREDLQPDLPLVLRW